MIRLAHETDLERIVDIYNQAVTRRFATADLEQQGVADRIAWFRDHEPEAFPIFVYELDDRVVGWCSLSSYRNRRQALLGTAEISYYLDYDFHGRGIGTALVEHAVAVAPSVGKRVLFAILLERNAASIRLLEKCGFERWAFLPEVAEIDGELVSQVYYGRQVGSP